MAEADQFSFDLKEVAAALIKQQDIHEGLWILNFELAFGAGYFGASPEQARPGAVVQINKVLLVRQPGGSPESLTAVDAATVNPAR
jgi:hypothetical protein